jgi:hypothetical protein
MCSESLQPAQGFLVTGPPAGFLPGPTPGGHRDLTCTGTPAYHNDSRPPHKSPYTSLPLPSRRRSRPVRAHPRPMVVPDFSKGFHWGDWAPTPVFKRGHGLLSGRPGVMDTNHHNRRPRVRSLSLEIMYNLSSLYNSSWIYI